MGLSYRSFAVTMVLYGRVEDCMTNSARHCPSEQFIGTPGRRIVRWLDLFS
jgi:hypothetical protein